MTDRSTMPRAPRRAAALSPKDFALTLGLALSLSALPQARAQSSEATRKPEAPRELSDAERARRDADKVSQWIRFVADRSAKATPAPTPTPQPAVKKATVKPEAVARAAAPAAAHGSAIRESVDAVAPPQFLLAADTSTAAPPADPTFTRQARPDTGVQLALAPRSLNSPLPQPPTPVQAPEPELEEEVLTPLVQVKPEFPRQLLNSLQGGTVAVQFVVKTDGSVDRVEAISSTHKRLSPAAIAAVQQWRFAPIKQERVAKVELGFQFE